MKTKKIFILPTILEGKSKIVELQGVMGTNEFISPRTFYYLLSFHMYMSTSYVSYTKPIFEVIKIPKILEKSSFFACVESKCVI